MTEPFDPTSHRRNSDPSTSDEAAEGISASQQRRQTVERHKIALLQAHLDALRGGNYQGLTAKETALRAGLDLAAATKRCSDLIDDGHLEWWQAGEGDLADRDGFLCRRNPESNVRARITVLTRPGIDWLQERLT